MEFSSLYLELLLCLVIDFTKHNYTAFSSRDSTFNKLSIGGDTSTKGAKIEQFKEKRCQEWQR